MREWSCEDWPALQDLKFQIKTYWGIREKCLNSDELIWWMAEWGCIFQASWQSPKYNKPKRGGSVVRNSVLVAKRTFLNQRIKICLITGRRESEILSRHDWIFVLHGDAASGSEHASCRIPNPCLRMVLNRSAGTGNQGWRARWRVSTIGVITLKKENFYSFNQSINIKFLHR
jgi:hypothetical protein